MLKINEAPGLPASEMVREAKAYATCQISDVMSGFGAMDYRIKPVCRGMKLAGIAMTANLSPGSCLMSHLAIALSGRGCVLVVNTNGNTSKAVLGDLMARVAVRKGIEGIVVDGLVRDIDGLRRLGWPVFALGAVPAAAVREGHGEINGPISCGGVAVHPGDLILGDDDGVVVVARQNIEAVLQAVKKKAGEEEQRIRDIDDGKIIPEWLEKKMAELGHMPD